MFNPVIQLFHNEDRRVEALMVTLIDPCKSPSLLYFLLDSLANFNFKLLTGSIAGRFLEIFFELQDSTLKYTVITHFLHKKNIFPPEIVNQFVIDLMAKLQNLIQ